MKKISLIFLFLGIFLLPSTSIAAFTGDACSPNNDVNFTFTLDATSYNVSNSLANINSSRYYYFNATVPGTITLKFTSPANKAWMGHSRSSCPVPSEGNTEEIEFYLTNSSLDFNLMVTAATASAGYNLDITFVPAPLTIIKTVLPAQVEANIENNVTYTIEIINNTDNNLVNLIMTDTLPFDPEDILSITADGWTCNMSEDPFPSSSFECNLSTLTTTASIEILVQVNLDDDIDNTASVKLDDTTFSSTATLQVVDGAAAVDLEIQKFASGIEVEVDDKNYTVVPPDTNFTYVIFVTNHAQGKYADLVTVTDIFPSQYVSFISYDRGSGWDCDIANVPTDSPGTFTCYFDRPMGHEITYFTITAHTDNVDHNVTATNEVNVTALNDDIGDHETVDTAEILIADLDLSTGGGSFGKQYIVGGPVEVSDIDLNPGDSRDNAYLQTKVASTTDETIGTYIINSDGNVDTYANVTTLYVNNKLVPLTVILKLGDKNCYLLDEPHLSYDESKVLAIFAAGDSYTPAAEDPLHGDIDFDLRNIAIRDARIIMQYVDINAKLDDANETCRVSSVDGNIKGLPQCLTNAASSNKFDNNKYINTFGIEAFVRCAINNGRPCSSDTGGYGDDPYDSEYGCYECTLGGFGACSKDNFAIRPKEFYADINSVPFNGDKEIFKAGEENNIDFKGLTAIPGEETLDYNETQIPETGLITDTFYVDANVSNNINCEVKSLKITPFVHFHDGSHPGPFSFNDIGFINFSIHETNGTEFANVDAGDTAWLDRRIEPFDVNFTVIPDHFNINAKLTDHNEANNFTYLHDINKYNTINDNHSMGAELNISIKAMNFNDINVTTNYTKECYAKDTNLTLILGDTNITYPGTKQALEFFLFYNSLEDNEGEYNLTLPPNTLDTSSALGTNILTITNLDINNSEASFPKDAPDGNGTTRIQYKLNFDRKLNLVVNPFKMVLTDVNITDEDDVNGSAVETAGTALLNQNATMYYARTHASKYFYDDISDPIAKTPIIINIYCNPVYVQCEDWDINTTTAQTNEYEWWLSLGHDRDKGDGNIELVEGVMTPSGPATVTKAHSVNIISNAKDENVQVTAGTGSPRPMTVEIDLVSNDSAAYYTNTWLIYNPDKDEVPSPFYKVRFIGQASWAGHGDTGHVIGGESNIEKNRRLEW